MVVGISVMACSAEVESLPRNCSTSSNSESSIIVTGILSLVCPGVKIYCVVTFA